MTGEERRTSPQPLPRRGALQFRIPTVDDGPGLYHLVRRSGTLSVNSCYAYCLIGAHFGPTSLVAERGIDLVGMIAAYRPPTRPEVLFVWQIAVDPGTRGRGLAKQMLHRLIELDANQDARFLEATVDPRNRASRRLFRAFARELHVAVEVEAGFIGRVMEPDCELSEELLTIGPLGTGS